MNLDIFSLKIVIYLTYLYLHKHIMINCLLHRVHTPSTFMSVPCFVSVYAIDYFLTRLLVTLLFITSQYSGTPPWTLHWTNRRGLDWKTLKTFQSSDKMKSKSCQLHHSAKCDWNIVLAWKLLLFWLLTEKILLTSKMMLSTLSGSQESANTTTMETNNAWVRDCFLIFSRSRFSCICKTKSGCWAAPSLFPFPSPLISNALNTKNFQVSNFLIKQYEKVSFSTSKPLSLVYFRIKVKCILQNTGNRLMYL